LATPPERQLPPPDAPVADETDVYRLVSVDLCDVIGGRWHFQSCAFDNSTPIHAGERDDEMSVVLGDTLTLLDRLPDNLPAESSVCVGDPELWGVAKLNAGFLKNDMEQSIHRSPKDDEPAHGDVRGEKKTSRRRKIKKRAEWVVEPAKPAA
jgi:hypothetical protein